MTEIAINGAELRSLNGKPPADNGDPPEADLVLRADACDGHQYLLPRSGKSFRVGLTQRPLASDPTPRGTATADESGVVTSFEPPEPAKATANAPARLDFSKVTLRGVSGKPGAESTNLGLVDVSLRLDVNEGVQALLMLLGKTFDLTFVQEVEQLDMFQSQEPTDEARLKPAGESPATADDEEPIVGPAHDGNGRDDWSTDRPPEVTEGNLRRIRRHAAVES